MPERKSDFRLPLSGGEGAGGRGNPGAGGEGPQLNIFDVIADVDAGLTGFPVRIRAWQKQRHSVTGLNDPEPRYVLEVAGDGREYTEITIACPEGWTAEESASGTVYLLDPAGAVHLPHKAVVNGLVKIADVAAFPSIAATRLSKEPWGGK